MKVIDDKFLLGKKFIDLFCGIGGFRYAMESFGAECVFSSDINKEARIVYEKNFGDEPFGDIKEIKEEDIPSHEIICAGFPCQPFSISGRQDGFNDPNGRLFFEIIRIAQYSHPEMIILENVKNLLKHDSGKSFETIKNALENTGYDVFYNVLNSVYFNVPQARKRLYIVAFRNDFSIKQFSFPTGKWESTNTLSAVLEDTVSQDLYITNTYEIINDAENALMPSEKLLKIGYTGLGRQGERIYSINGPAITLSAQGGGPAGKTGMYLIHNDLRRLSARECARVMGFPDEHKLANTIGKNYKQFGNSVVINVLQAIIEKAGRIITGVDENE